MFIHWPEVTGDCRHGDEEEDERESNQMNTRDPDTELIPSLLVILLAELQGETK